MESSLLSAQCTNAMPFVYFSKGSVTNALNDKRFYACLLFKTFKENVKVTIQDYWLNEVHLSFYGPFCLQGSGFGNQDLILLTQLNPDPVATRNLNLQHFIHRTHKS